MLRWWLAAVCLVAGAHLCTVRLSPVIWRDEVQIVDFGRVLLDPTTPWSVNWSSSGRPVRGIAYLASAGQELAYRIAGHSMRGPRVLSLLGAVCAAWAALYWLSARAALVPAALAASLVLLLDPLFTENYRGARVDVWAIGCGMWACGLLRRTADDGALHVRRRLLLGGFLAGLLPFIWSSSLLLFPLLAAEGIPVTWRDGARRSAAIRILWLLCGAGLSVTIVLLPIAGRLTDILPQTFSGAARDLTGPTVLTNVANLVAIVMRSPWLVLFGTAGAIVGRERRRLGVIVLLLGFMLLTRLYGHRFVYLLPCLMAGFADFLVVLAARSRPGRTMRNVCLALTVVWGVGLSVGARSTLAFAQRKARNPDRLLALASRAEVPGGARVYLGSWEMYYAGRALDWRLYKPFAAGESRESRENCDDSAFPTFLSTMDFAVFAEPTLDDDMARCLAQAGLWRGPTLDDGQSGAGLRAFGREWGARPYGALVVFARRGSP